MTLVCQSFKTMGIIIQIHRANGCIPVKNNKQPIQCSARNGERKITVFSCYCSISWWHSRYIFTLWSPRTERCHRYKTLIQIRRSLVEPIRTRVIRKWINVGGELANGHSFVLWGQMLKRLGPGYLDLRLDVWWHLLGVRESTRQRSGLDPITNWTFWNFSAICSLRQQYLLNDIRLIFHRCITKKIRVN